MIKQRRWNSLFMATSSGDSTHLKNRLLAALDHNAFARLAPHLEVVALTPREVLFEAGTALRHVYFPHSGIICLMAAMRDGVAETAAVGSEGFVGFEVVLGGETAANRALVQLSGSASRIPVVSLGNEMQESPRLRWLLLSYVRFFLIQALQSVACSTLHTVDERCAKWLLMAHDRGGHQDTFNLTQEFLAEMLGVHRPSVTLVARTLQNAGLIRYSRGVITITDRRGLEEVACDCYGVVRGALEKILHSLMEGMAPRASL
jgi:CRP-like cAMP-binding protein